MFRHKLKECSGVLTAASNFASARTLCWVRADRLDAALLSETFVPEAPIFKPAEDPVEVPVENPGPYLPQQDLTTGAAPDSETIASNSQSPETPVPQESVLEAELLVPPVELPYSEQPAKHTKQTARKRQGHVVAPLSEALLRTTAACSSGAAGSHQAASTQLNNAAVCPPAQSGSKRTRDDHERPGSESPSSPCSNAPIVSHQNRQEQQQQQKQQQAGRPPQPLPLQSVRSQHPLEMAQQPEQAIATTAPAAALSDPSLPSWKRPLGSRDPEAHARIEALRAKYLARTIFWKQAGKV